MKNKKTKIIVLIIVLLAICLIGVGIYIYEINTEKYTGIISSTNDNEVTIIEKDKIQSVINDINLSDIPKDFKIQDAIEQGCFVITPDKIYNKNKLDSFINNTKFDAENRIEDKIRIAVYGIIDGNGPSIYDLEYKILEEKYINSEQKEVNKATYMLTTDNSRIQQLEIPSTTEELYEYHKIKTNSNIPAEYYGIQLKDESGVGAYSLVLSLCVQPLYSNNTITPYKEEIEIARYSATAEIVEMKEETDFDTGKNPITVIKNNK